MPPCVLSCLSRSGRRHPRCEPVHPESARAGRGRRGSSHTRGWVMATRPSWEGHLTFNLVSIPVKAFNAVGATSGKIGFHLLHKGCNERIRYKKVCPVHGEVENDDIVSGYEYQKG